MAIDNSQVNRPFFHHPGPHPGPQGKKDGAGVPHQQEPGQEQLLSEAINHSIFAVQQISPLIQSH